MLLLLSAGEGKGVCEEGAVHAVSLFLRPVRTLSETQPELINSNRPPHYPQCTVPRWGPVGGNTRNERKKNPPSSHTLLVYTHFSLARTAHNTPTVSQCCNNKHLQ